MAKILGPTFGAEIIAACGGPLDGVSWETGGTDNIITGRAGLTSGQNATLDAVIAAHDATARSAADIIAERERRLSLGFEFDFGDARGVHRIGTTPTDMSGWDEVSKFASALIATGDTTTRIDIVTNTGPTSVTAQEWQQVLIAAAQFRQPIWAQSFVLQANRPIRADYAADANWPPVQQISATVPALGAAGDRQAKTGASASKKKRSRKAN